MSHLTITENLVKEEIMPYFGFRGHVHLQEGVSTRNAPAQAPADIIQTDQSFKVVFHWHTKGNLNYIMCGKWKARIYFERMGKKEFGLPSKYTASYAQFVQCPHHYECEIEVPPYKVPKGVYRIVATLTLEGESGVPAPVAAFADLGLVQFYDEGPGYGHYKQGATAAAAEADDAEDDSDD